MQSSLFRAARTVPNRVAASHARFFNIHEYQGKILCDRYGVPVQKWRAASTPEEAAAGAESLGECPPRLGADHRTVWVAFFSITAVVTTVCRAERRGSGWQRRR